MNLLIGLKVGSVLTVAYVAALTVTAAPLATAHTQDDKAKQAEAKAVYSYVAQPSDSYTKIARKAVQTYGLKHKINLSQAEIVFAETNLTLAAGSPILNVGQKVEVKESTIHEWADKAQQLTDTQKAAWNRYVQFVDFNTNNVGQSR